MTGAEECRRVEGVRVRGQCSVPSRSFELAEGRRPKLAAAGVVDHEEGLCAALRFIVAGEIQDRQR